VYLAATPTVAQAWERPKLRSALRQAQILPRVRQVLLRPISDSLPASVQQDCPQRVAELRRTEDQGGACGAAGPASAPGSAFPEARPAHAGPHLHGPLIKQTHTVMRTGVQRTASFLTPDCPSRGHRVNGGPNGPSHAIGYADH